MHITTSTALLLAVGPTYGFQGESRCPPFKGDVTVEKANIYPEGADFATSSCTFFMGSLNNGSVIEFSPYNSTVNTIELPEVGHNSDFFVCGIDYGHVTGDIYISASARDPWVPTIGGNLQGPNRLIRYSTRDKTIRWQANVDSLVKRIEKQIDAPVAGFQDSAEDMNGNAYFVATFSNVILKVEPDGHASKFYCPDHIDLSYGFGGMFVTQDNILVLGDAVSRSFVSFNLSSSTPSSPTFSKPSNHPDTLEVILDCDAVIAPARYRDRVALCSSVVDRAISPHGSIMVYVSEDGWKTTRFAGAVPTEFGQTPDVWSTAQISTPDRVYALSSALPYDSGHFPTTRRTTLVDITAKIDRLVGEQMILSDSPGSRSQDWSSDL